LSIKYHRFERKQVNKCHFLGKLVDNLEMSVENGASVVRFTLEIEEYRKGKDREKIRSFTYLDFEAWDTAAHAIEKYAFDGCLMAIESIARNTSEPHDDQEYIIFRITNFKILH